MTMTDSAMITRSRGGMEIGPICQGCWVEYWAKEREEPPKKYR